jgi:hypothetical protein
VSDAGPPAPGRPIGHSLDWPSIATGAAVALAIVVVCGIAIHGASAGSAGVLFLGVVIGFGLGGAIAGRHSPDRYNTHGAAAGAISVAAYLVIALAVHAATGRKISVVALVFTALLGTCCGMLGANVGDWRRRKREDAAADAPDDGS